MTAAACAGVIEDGDGERKQRFFRQSGSSWHSNNLIFRHVFGYRLDLSAVKPRTNTRLDANLIPLPKAPPHASRPPTPAARAATTTTSRPASPAGRAFQQQRRAAAAGAGGGGVSHGGRTPARKPGWGSGALLPDARPTPRRPVGVGKVKQVSMGLQRWARLCVVLFIKCAFANVGVYTLCAEVLSAPAGLACCQRVPAHQ